jgi:hypothetical protein
MIMRNAYGYQHSFDDPLAREFRQILSLDSPTGPNPCGVSGVKVWFEASDVASLQLNKSSNVSQWQDKSGFENHALQADITKQPVYVSNGINGKPALYSDGKGRILNFTHPIKLGDSYSIFVVLKADVSKADPTPGSALNAALAFGNATSASSAFAIRQTRDTPDVLRTTSYGGGGIFNNGNSNAILCSAIYDGKNLETYKNGALIDKDAVLQADESITGGYIFNDNTSSSQRSFMGWISDILIFDSVLRTADRKLVEACLIQKRGII